MKKKLFAAYGTDTNEALMGWKCPGAKVVAKSWLFDHQLVFHGYPKNAHASIIPSEGYDVPVIVWEISELDEMALDRHEGVRSGHAKKDIVQIEVDGEMREAIIYTMASESVGTPSDSYLEIMARGYKKFNLDVRILNDAVIYANEHAARPATAM